MKNLKPIVIPVILKGINYLLWARITWTALCGRGLWSHVEISQAPGLTMKEDGGDSTKGKEEEPMAEGTKWFQEDQTVLGLLQNLLDSPILEAYSYCETSKELWDTLKNIYGNISNLTRVFDALILEPNGFKKTRPCLDSFKTHLMHRYWKRIRIVKP
ncbi:hypothetical protein V5N11_026703 [Cardamine amara subsp. amara]|uniref:Uncharacterized protein n=1 Tax=Cardamine amara subsp. amara TaxID=228776 RepID=A0ABD1AFV2_CARAN